MTLLTGRALEAYAGMDEEQAESYGAIKAAVRTKYNVSVETYRQRFRSIIVPAGETVCESYNRLKGLYKRWMRPDICTKDQVGEVIILEQYLRVLQPDVRTWVKEHNPQTGEKAADLAERYMAAHRGPIKRVPRYEGHRSINTTDSSNTDRGVRRRPTMLHTKGELICFCCQQPGHKASVCPLKKKQGCRNYFTA